MSVISLTNRRYSGRRLGGGVSGGGSPAPPVSNRYVDVSGNFYTDENGDFYIPLSSIVTLLSATTLLLDGTILN